jgi:hypothetical protein
MKSGIKLNYPKLSLPDSPESIAFDAVEWILETDPQLMTATELFLSWKGNVEDLWDPAVNTCPFLRISPGGLPSGWETEGQHRMPMAVSIEAAVAGSDRKQMLRYWGAVRNALWPVNDPIRQAAIQAKTIAAKISRPILSAPAYGVIEVGEKEGGPRITLATGTLTLILLISTP